MSRREISNGQNEKHITRNRLVHKSHFLNFIYIAAFCRLSSKVGAFPVPTASGSQDPFLFSRLYIAAREFFYRIKLSKASELTAREKNATSNNIRNYCTILVDQALIRRRKIHKDGVPQHPIVSAVGPPCYRLAKEVARILSPLEGHNGYTVKNSTAFVDKKGKPEG